MLALILKGMVEGKNLKGRQRISYKGQIMRDIGCKFFTEMKRFAYKKEQWRLPKNVHT